jgi:hypothetical protein
MIRGRARLVCVLFLCVFIGACSATRVLYNQLDWVVVWYLNGYFSLDDTQEEQLRAAVVRNLEWHRRNQLPEYAAFCRQLLRDTGGELTPELLEARFERMTELWDDFLRHALPDISAFFVSLSDEQVEEFIGNLEDNNQELWDEYAGEAPEERIARREKAAVKGFKRVLGRLTAEQTHVIREHMANMHDVSEYWLESRRRWQRDFRDLVIEGPAEPAFSERLTALMLDPNRGDDAAYRRQVDENRRTFIAMTIAVAQTATERQRTRVNERLQDFARDFEILAIQQL